MKGCCDCLFDIVFFIPREEDACDGATSFVVFVIAHMGNIPPKGAFIVCAWCFQNDDSV